MDKTTYNLLESETFLNKIGVETRQSDDDHFRSFKEVFADLIVVWNKTSDKEKVEIINSLNFKD